MLDQRFVFYHRKEERKKGGTDIGGGEGREGGKEGRTGPLMSQAGEIFSNEILEIMYMLEILNKGSQIRTLMISICLSPVSLSHSPISCTHTLCSHLRARMNSSQKKDVAHHTESFLDTPDFYNVQQMSRKRLNSQ